jgi:serine/threonine protein kinase
MEDRGGADVCPACGWLEGTPTANPVHLPPRSLLRDHYVLGRVLGHGGFGIAYLAWDPDLQMKVAVKEYLPGDHATRGVDGSSVRPYSGESQEHFEYGLTKFLEEGRAVVRFNEHPGIVSVLGFFRANGTGYLVMPYVPGMSLKQYLASKGGRLPYEEAIGIAMPVMDTLRVVHEAGLLHRDISPDNIYLSESKRVKLLDFGAARHALGDRSKSLSVILKAGYAPFEQYQTRGRQGPWTDVYALAATIYRAITGDSPPEATSRIVEDDLEPPRAKGVRMPAEAERVLLRALAVDATDRYQQVVDFQQALLRVTPDPPSESALFADAARDVPWNAAGTDAAASTSSHSRGVDRADREGRDRRVPGPRSVVQQALARALRVALDLLEPPARVVEEQLARATGLRASPDARSSAQRVALIVALLVGLAGLWASVPLAWRFAGIAVTSGPAVMAVALLRALAGVMGATIMTIAAAGGLAGDDRGRDVVWASGWTTIALGLGGMALQLLTYLPHTALAYMGVAFTSELTLVFTAFAPAPIIVVLLLLWIRSRR